MDLDADELVPEPGKHEEFDEIEQRITKLKEELDQELKKLRKKTG